MQKYISTVLDMLQQREYTEIQINDGNVLAIKRDGNPIIVFFSETPKFTVKSIQAYISAMNDMKIFHAIIVYMDSITAFTKKAIGQSREMKFEIFPRRDLQYNITNHRLQPKFEALAPEEAIAFKKEYGTKFGVMRVSDPIARFYGYHRGDVIRLTRDHDGMPFISYRIVKG